MRLKHLDEGFALLLLLLGAWIVWSALVYGYIEEGVPGPGFFPFWAGLFLAGLSLVNLVRSTVGRAVLGGRIEPVHLGVTLAMVAATAAFLLAIPYLGMTVGVFLLMVVVGWAAEERQNRTRAFALKLVALSFGLAACLYALFAFVLHVPLETGPLGI